MADRSKGVFDYTERSIAEDHARHRDVVSQPTDRPATGHPSNVRPMWSNTREVALAQQVRSWIDREEYARATGSPIGKPHEEVARVWPDARRWGTDVLVAAVQPAHAEKCHWLSVVQKAMSDRVHQRSASLPMFTKALTNLLGPPCNRCVKLMRGMAKSRVNSGRVSQIRAAGQGRRADVGTRRGVPSPYGVTAGAGGGRCCQTFADTGRVHWSGCHTRRGR